MSTVFSEISFTLETLVSQIRMGYIALPDLQRPFVWPNKKVRDLFDSMYRGYPVGYLLVWQSMQAAAPSAKGIGTDPKQATHNLLVIDGQQRLTSLYSVFNGEPVLRGNFKKERLVIAFCPLDGEFAVSDAAIKKDPAWIPDISVLWQENASLLKVLRSYREGLERSREITETMDQDIELALQKLQNLKSFPFTALQLSANVDEEQVAEVFVRINSKGTPLKQADFILTLMSVFKDDLRRRLEAFCRGCRTPSKTGATPFNYFIEPEPDHLLRVAVGLGFRRAKLETVYSILRGKDLETKEFSNERRDEQFQVLEDAHQHVLDVQDWHEFLKCLQRAGYRSDKQITSKIAAVYCYTLYLIGRRDYKVDLHTLRNLIARWFFFINITSRYTGSSESRMEQDLADLRDAQTGEELVRHLERVMATSLTDDFWNITLPADLITSSARTPELYSYNAALCLLDAKGLFSDLKVSDLLDPAIKGTKSALERHHLFPKAYLKRQGFNSRRQTNQIANYALVEWPDNIKISDQTPSVYWSRFSTRYTAEELEQVCFLHALPANWTELPYLDFLEQRRKGIAAVIRRGFESLRPEASTSHETPVDMPALATEGDVTNSVLGRLRTAVRDAFEDLLDEPLAPTDEVLRDVRTYLGNLEILKEYEEFLDIDSARRVAESCERLLEEADSRSAASRKLIQAAAYYFMLDEDADNDIASINGFDDDLEVANAVSQALEVALPANGAALEETTGSPVA